MRMAGASGISVVLLPGLWSPRIALAGWAWHLRAAGFRTERFGYRAVGCDLDANAAALALRLAQLPSPVHLVGHSLGGLVIRSYGRHYGWDRVARVVMVGTPNQGSRTADGFARFPGGVALMGKSIAALRAGVLGPGYWDGPELGLIAGSRRGFPRRGRVPYDGLVAADEVWLPEARDRLLLPVSHAGMLVAPSVARAITQFLRQGWFVEGTAETGGLGG